MIAFISLCILSIFILLFAHTLSALICEMVWGVSKCNDFFAVGFKPLAITFGVIVLSLLLLATAFVFLAMAIKTPRPKKKK